jgi:hypothetical protein
VAGSGLTGGTYLAAAGGTNPFTTPFTTTGLVTGPGGTPVPEPTSIFLLGTVSLFIIRTVKKKAIL